MKMPKAETLRRRREVKRKVTKTQAQLGRELAEKILKAAGLKPPNYSIEYYFGESSIQSPATHAIWERITIKARELLEIGKAAAREYQ